MKGIDWEGLNTIQDEVMDWRASLVTELSHKYVSGEGDNPDAFIIGEAPGAQEEVRRRPFVGPAGVVMRDLMAIAGLYSSADDKRLEGLEGGPNCWLTNVVKFRPMTAGKRNRKPTPFEVQAFRPWLRREWIAVGKPRLIIPVGGLALEAVTGKKVSILQVAGKPQEVTSREGLQLFMWPMVHPSFGLRVPAIRRLIEMDWEHLAMWRKHHEG